MITTEKLTDKQKAVIAAIIALILIAGAILIFVKKKAGNSYDNVIKLAKIYSDKGEYDRALSMLDSILLKDSDNPEVVALLNQIVQLKQESEQKDKDDSKVQVQVPVPVNSNVTVDFDTDDITNAMADSISSMKSALAESNKQAEENRRVAEDNRRAMEQLIKMQEQQKKEDDKRREEEAVRIKKLQQELDERKAEEEASAKQKKIAEEKRKVQEAEIAKKNAELKKKIDEVNDEVTLGKTALATGNYEEAMKHFQKADSMLPGVNSENFTSSKKSEIAQALLEASEKSQSKEEKQRLLNEAVEMAKKALEENQNDSGAHYVMAQDALNKKDWKLALSELNKAVQNDPDNYLYYYDMGKVLYNLKKYQEAQVAFETSCSKNGNFAPSRYNLGITQLKLKNENGALSSFRKALDINPRHEKAYLEEARLLSKRGDYSGAIASYQNVLKINNTNIDAVVELGSVYYMTGKYSQAEENYRKVIKTLQPSELLTLTEYNLSTVLFDEEKFTEAEKWAEEAYKGVGYIANDKSKANIIYNYALILDKNRKSEAAIPLYLEVLQYNPEHIKTKINLAVMYMNLTPPDPDMALSLLSQVFSSDKNNFEAVNNIGSAFLMKEDYKNAIKYYQNALKIESKNVDVQLNLARAFAKNKEYENSKAAFIELIKNDGKQWIAYIELAKVCLQLNENNLAEGYLLTLKEKNPSFQKNEVDNLLSSIAQ